MAISIASNFDLASPIPIDSRMVTASIASRNAIPSGSRYEGQVVYVIADATEYILKGGIANANWAVAGGGDLGPIEDDVEELMGLKTIMTTVDPTVNDDIGDFINEGTIWYNITSKATFILVDNTLGAAVWASLADPNAVTSSTSPSLDNYVPVYDGVTGKKIKQSVVNIDPSGQINAANISAPNELTTSSLSGIQFSNATITATGSLNLDLRAAGTNAMVKHTTRSWFDNTQVFSSTVDTATSTNATLTAPTKKYVRLTDGGLNSVAMIPAALANQELVIINGTNRTVRFLHDSGATAANRLFLGGTTVSLEHGKGLLFSYDTTLARWILIGSAGAGSSGGFDTIMSLEGGDASQWNTEKGNMKPLEELPFQGLFVANSTNPIQGTVDYKYTQGTNPLGDSVASPVAAVDPKFRGTTTTIYGTYAYDGNTNDIEVFAWDEITYNIIPGASMRLPTTGGALQPFALQVNIPIGTTQVRMGFWVRVANVGKILRFDSIVWSSDTTKYGSGIESQTQYIGQGASFTNAGITGSPTFTSGGGLFSYNAATGNYTFLKRANIVATTSMRAASASAIQAQVYVGPGARGFGNNTTGAGQWSNSSYTGEIQQGEIVKFVNNASGASDNQQMSVSAWAVVSGVLTPSDMFSTDTAKLTWASSTQYTRATLPNSPIGTVLTYIYNAGTMTQATTRPNQTDAEFNTQGLLLIAKAYAGASLATQPVRYEINVGKGMQGWDWILYKTSAKTLTGSLKYFMRSSDTDAIGAQIVDYDPSTGIATIDAGYQYGSVTSAGFRFSDNSYQSFGYVQFVGQKTPLPSVTPFAPNIFKANSTSGQSIPNGVSTNIKYNNVVHNTKGTWDATTGIFTSGEAGYYKASACIEFVASAWVIGNIYALFIGAKEKIITVETTGNVNRMLDVEDTVFLPVGGTLYATCYHSKAAAIALTTNPIHNVLTIQMVR